MASGNMLADSEKKIRGLMLQKEKNYVRNEIFGWRLEMNRRGKVSASIKNKAVWRSTFDSDWDSKLIHE